MFILLLGIMLRILLGAMLQQDVGSHDGIKCKVAGTDITERASFVEKGKEPSRKEIEVYLGQMKVKKEQAFTNRVKYTTKKKENFNEHLVNFKLGELFRNIWQMV
ncbi:hypothetical protein BT69DRAFT_1296174 [Atractiella rhizophila]|nr:hypothetical protein BT69DRAFT_1296174 [Atractiella rhizophila]